MSVIDKTLNNFKIHYYEKFRKFKLTRVKF